MQLHTNVAGALEVNEEPKSSSGAVSWMMGLAALLTFEALFLIFIIYGVATVDTDGSISLLSILGLVFLSPPALFLLLAVQTARGNRAAPRLATECYLVLLLLLDFLLERDEPRLDEALLPDEVDGLCLRWGRLRGRFAADAIPLVFLGASV